MLGLLSVVANSDMYCALPLTKSVVDIIVDTTHGYNGQGKTWTHPLEKKHSSGAVRHGHMQSTDCSFVIVLDALKDTLLWWHLG